METRVLFVRHARADLTVRDDRTRPLTATGAADSEAVATALDTWVIHRVYSSPYTRAVQTVTPLARARRLSIELREAQRERAIGRWVEDIQAFFRAQWSDFEYRLEGGESLHQAQVRLVADLHGLVAENEGRTIVVGTHGTSLCLILNHADASLGLESFLAVVDRMPWVHLCIYDGPRLVGREDVAF